MEHEAPLDYQDRPFQKSEQKQQKSFMYFNQESNLKRQKMTQQIQAEE